MARTKKLTDPIYSPTNPTSEAAIRAQIDDSIQEVYDQSARNNETVNLTGNQTVAGIKTFSSSPIVPTPTTSTQVANKAYVDGVAISATIPLDSLTDDYLASAPGNIKPRVATLETDFSTAQTDITNLETDIDIITTAVSDTGLVNAMVVNTAGTFDMAKNGNVTPFIIPLFTNTATATLSIDGGAVTGIRKANAAGTLVVLEAGDIKKNVPTQFVLDTVSGFFVYAPKGGANLIKTWKNQTVSNNPLPGATAVTTRLTVNGSGWVVAIVANSADSIRLTIDGVVKIGSVTESLSIENGTTRFVMFKFNTSFVFANSGLASGVVYCLGDEFEKADFVIYNPFSATTTTLRTNVSGKGWIYALNSPSTQQGVKLIIDGVQVCDKKLVFGYPLIARFESSFQFYDENGFVNLNYVLD